MNDINITKIDRDAVKAFWENYNPDVDMDEQLAFLAASGRAHGESVSVEIERQAAVSREVAVVIKRFIKVYASETSMLWWKNNLPGEFLRLVLEAPSK